MAKLVIMQFSPTYCCDYELWFDNSSCVISPGLLTTYAVFCNKKKKAGLLEGNLLYKPFKYNLNTKTKQ